MKTLLVGLMTALGVAFSIAGSEATTLADNISVEAGVSYSNSSTSGGLAVRDEAFGYSLLLGAPVSGGALSVGLDLYEGDDNSDLDIAVAWGKPISILDQPFEAEVYFQKIESAFGGWEEVGLGLTYAHSLADLTASVWHELGSSASYGVELTVSRTFDTPVENLTATPFITANFADSYNAVEVGATVDYDFGNGLSVGLKTSYNHNDVSNSPYALDHDWKFGLGFNYKF
tara:strand:+ start:15 stop:704 length:690 start_codon:yes stop_codon:yes gene_type:complete